MYVKIIMLKNGNVCRISEMRMMEEFRNIGHFLSHNCTFYIITLSIQKLIPKIITNIFQENAFFVE